MKTTPLDSFLKFYVMGSTQVDLYGIAHVSRLHSASENVCHLEVRKVCLNYMFCTMCSSKSTFWNFLKIFGEIPFALCPENLKNSFLGKFLRRNFQKISVTLLIHPYFQTKKKLWSDLVGSFLDIFFTLVTR